MSTARDEKNDNLRTSVPATMPCPQCGFSHANGEPCALNPGSKALWTNGLPDRDKIKQRMEQTLQAYLRQEHPRVNTGPFQWAREIIAIKRAQAEFYAEMHYLDDLLYAYPVLSLPVESTTTIVTDYTPKPQRKRGRPSTGGRKPRASRRNTDADPY